MPMDEMNLPGHEQMYRIKIVDGKVKKTKIKERYTSSSYFPLRNHLKSHLHYDEDYNWYVGYGDLN